MTDTPHERIVRLVRAARVRAANARSAPIVADHILATHCCAPTSDFDVQRTLMRAGVIGYVRDRSRCGRRPS